MAIGSCDFGLVWRRPTLRTFRRNVAVIFATPGAIALTTPVETVATSAFEDCQVASEVTTCSVESDIRAVATI